MIIIPAIDIRNGKVVRLFQGDFSKETIYSGDPINMAVRWEREGAKMLHVVDLDGASQGTSNNLPIIKEIVSAIKIPVELGGGLRTEKKIETILACGVRRAIIGTKAFADPNFVKKLIRKYKEAIVIGVDAAKNKVVCEGWRTQTSIKLKDIIKKFTAMGVESIIYTDIFKDGTMQGPNIKRTEEILDSTSCNIIASGGVSSLDDIKALKALGRKNLTGVIIGKALYEGAFTLQQANEVLE